MTISIARYLITTIVIFQSLLFASAAPPIKNKVTSLPGLREAVHFSQWTGYIPVNEAHGRYLFYWFVESQRSPADDPVVLWFTGGPEYVQVVRLFSPY
jgi:serine carboxypeptidase-like clade 1